VQLTDHPSNAANENREDVMTSPTTKPWSRGAYCMNTLVDTTLACASSFGHVHTKDKVERDQWRQGEQRWTTKPSRETRPTKQGDPSNQATNLDQNFQKARPSRGLVLLERWTNIITWCGVADTLMMRFRPPRNVLKAPRNLGLAGTVRLVCSSSPQQGQGGSLARAEETRLRAGNREKQMTKNNTQIWVTDRDVLVDGVPVLPVEIDEPFPRPHHRLPRRFLHVVSLCVGQVKPSVHPRST
jgi:hypothetical protein